MFICYKGRYILGIGNDWTICSWYIFSAVSMVTQKPVSPEKDHFNLKLYISTSICRTLSNNISLKLSLLVQNCVSFLKLFMEKLPVKLLFWHYREAKHTFEDHVLLLFLSSFNQIFYRPSTVDGCPDIGLENLIRKGFFNQKRNEFLRFSIRYDK